jgi:hypothetical protein
VRAAQQSRGRSRTAEIRENRGVARVFHTLGGRVHTTGMAILAAGHDREQPLGELGCTVPRRWTSRSGPHLLGHRTPAPQPTLDRDLTTDVPNATSTTEESQ